MIIAKYSIQLPYFLECIIKNNLDAHSLEIQFILIYDPNKYSINLLILFFLKIFNFHYLLIK